MTHTWITTYMEWSNKDQQPGKVVATVAHWNVSRTDGGFSGKVIGSVNLSDQNRVYTQAALENVPANVIQMWVDAAIGAEDMQIAEDAVDAIIAEQATPTTGGFEVT